jgi:hypothetical protein
VSPTLTRAFGRAFSLSSFGSVFQVNLVTGSARRLLDSVCTSGGSHGALSLPPTLTLIRGGNPVANGGCGVKNFGPPRDRPMCTGFTGLAATILSGSLTKLFVTLEPFGGFSGASQADPGMNDGGPMRSVVELVLDHSLPSEQLEKHPNQKSSVLLLNSSTPHMLYPSGFSHAASFNVASYVQVSSTFHMSMQPGKYFAG